MNSPLVFSKIDIFRNLKGYPFVPKLNKEQALEIEEKLIKGIEKVWTGDVKKIREIPEDESEKLYESFEISRILIDHAEFSSYIKSGQTTLFLMEKEHLRISSWQKGFSIEEVFDQAYKVENSLDQVFDFAFNPDFGYLNSNVLLNGHGFKLSIIIHLKGFKEAELLETLIQSMRSIGFKMKPVEAMKGLDFYEISYEKNVAASQEEVLERFIPVVERIYKNERELRENMQEANSEKIKDQYYRAIGTLIYSQVISQKEVAEMLSHLLYGYSFGLEELTLENIREIFEMSQKFHMIEYKNSLGEMRSLDSLRGDRIRDYLLKEVSYGK